MHRLVSGPFPTFPPEHRGYMTSATLCEHNHMNNYSVPLDPGCLKCKM